MFIKKRGRHDITAVDRTDKVIPNNSSSENQRVNPIFISAMVNNWF